MNTSKNLKIAAVSALLLSLVSCGGNNSSKSAPEAQVDQIRAAGDWKIFGTYPMNALVEINDEIVLNECADKQPATINRNTNPHSLTLVNRDMPAEGTAIKLVVSNCEDTSDITTATDSVAYEMVKTGTFAELVINF